MKRATHLQPVTFEPISLIDDWLGEYEYTGSALTLRNYRDIATRVLLPFLDRQGVKDVGDITPQHMRAYMAEQAAWRYVRGGETHSLSASEIQKRWQTAFRWLGWCVENGTIDVHPMAKLRRPKMPSTGKVAFDRDEVRRMMVVLNAKPGWLGARDRAIVTLLLATGARAAELLGITLSDVDWPRKRVLLHGKGKKDRWMPLGKAGAKSLRDWLRVRPRVPSSSLWVSQRLTPFTYASLSKMVEHLGEYAGVEGATPHRFRHTFATNHYLANKDLLAVRHALGHEHVEVTMRYLHALGVDMASYDDHANPADWLTS